MDFSNTHLQPNDAQHLNVSMKESGSPSHANDVTCQQPTEEYYVNDMQPDFQFGSR